MHPFWVNGLWPLCGHKQPSPLLLDHVQDGLHRNGSRGFYSRPGELHGKHQLCKQLAILQFQRRPSLLPWQTPLFKLSFLTQACMKASFSHFLVWIWSELCWGPSPTAPTFSLIKLSSASTNCGPCCSSWSIDIHVGMRLVVIVSFWLI